MAHAEGTGYCPYCHEQRLTRRTGTNHALHGILTLVTLGAWSLVWLVVGISNRYTAPVRCTVCGTRLLRGKFGRAENYGG